MRGSMTDNGSICLNSGEIKSLRWSFKSNENSGGTLIAYYPDSNTTIQCQVGFSYFYTSNELVSTLSVSHDYGCTAYISGFISGSNEFPVSVSIKEAP